MTVVQQTFAIGWFPPSDWSLALQRWPALGDDLPHDHDGYRGSVEGRMRNIRDRARGMRLLMVPVTVQDIEDQALADGADPDSAEVRGRAASRLAQQGAGRQWPPARNDRCWCGSTAKYKFCCRALADTALPPAAEPPDRTPAA